MTVSNKRPRATWHDYNAGIYFITIITNNRCQYFGKIVDGTMVLNHCGRIAQEQIDLLSQRLEYVEVHNAIVMPNHVHLLLQIIPTRYGITIRHNCTNTGALHAPEHPSELEQPFEERNHFASLLSTAICSLKSGISREIRRAGYSFEWQSRYHDHIVRDQLEYNNITDYITTNPQRWESDKYAL